MKMWTSLYTQNKFVRKVTDSWALWEDCLFIVTANSNKLFSERLSSATFNTAQPSGITVVLQILAVWEHSGEGSKVCLFQPCRLIWVPPKARLPSLEVGRQMNIAIHTFTILSDLAPTYFLELIEKTMSHPKFKIFWKYPESFSHEEGATWNKFLFWPPKSGTLCQRHWE